MGRIKTKRIKALTNDVYDRYKDKVSTKFEENKQLLNEVQDSKSKKLRNIMAGYATRLKKRDIKLEL